MSKTKKSTEKQWHSVLKIDHNHRGEIISRDEYKRQSRRQHTSKSKQSHSKSPGRTKTSQSKKGKDSSVRSRSQSPDQLEIDQSQQTYKSKTSARSSSSKQSTCIPNVLLSRNVTPRIFPPGERCMINMMYFGSELKVEYDREWFEPDGEEIIVMQQHCGGENLVAFKGFLKPKDIFSFESARQTDYPFALTCFINGTMYNRLSLCCESRCKNGMRIGGRHGMFCVIDVQKERPCRRCRYEKRMKKLMEDDGKSSTSSERQLCPKSTKSSRLRSKSPAIREENSKSNTKSKKPVRSITAPTTSKSVTDSKYDAKKNDTSKESSDSFDSDSSSGKPVATREPNTNKPMSASRQDDSDSSDGKPDATRKLNTDTPAPTSNPDDSDASVQELSHVRSSSSEAFTSHNPNPEGTGAYRKNSDSSDSESANRKVAASRKMNANTPAPTSHQDDSDASVQELSQFRSSSSEAFTSHNSNPKETRTSRKNSNSSDSDSSSGKPVTSRKLNDNTTRTLTPLPHSDSLNTSPQRQSPLRTPSPDSEERPQSPRKLTSTQQTNSNGKYNTISSLVQKLGNNDSSTVSQTNDNERSSSPSSTTSNTGRNTTNDQVYPWMNHQQRQSDQDNKRDSDDSDNDNKDDFK